VQIHSADEVTFFCSRWGMIAVSQPAFRSDFFSQNLDAAQSNNIR